MSADVIVGGIVGQACAWAGRQQGPRATGLTAGLEQEVAEFIRMAPELVAASVQDKPWTIGAVLALQLGPRPAEMAGQLT